MPPSALDLPEIHNLIAEHLSRETLLSCCRVSKDWHHSFLPYLWRSVDFHGSGPVFLGSDIDPRVAHIRRLNYNYSTFEGPMPTVGYTHLKELEIIRESVVKERKLVLTRPKGGCALNLWHLPTALLRSQVNGPLTSVELTGIDNASIEFWDALSQCRSLMSFRLENVYCPVDWAPFWKICLCVKTLAFVLTEGRDCLIIRRRMFLVKHLTVDRSEIEGQRDNWQLAKSWTCSPNLETLKYCRSSTSPCEDELHEMAEDIKAAIAAAAEGRNHYARAPKGVIQSSGDGDDDEHDGDYDYINYNDDDKEKDEDMEQYRGLIPGKKLHTLETDNHDIRDEDLGFIVNNMDTLRKLCVPYFSFGVVTFEALDRHRHTIVELNLRCGPNDSSQVLNTVTKCTQLQILTLSDVDSEAFVQSDSWTCLGLKLLAITFQKWGADQSNRQIASESQAVWQRVSRLTELEHLDLFPHGGWNPGFQPVFSHQCGLGQLSTLTELRQIDMDFLQAIQSNAHWMVGAWPRLKVVRCQNLLTDRGRINAAVMQVFRDKEISVEARGIRSVYEPL
ncbi:MAG: hypothetical protein BYD32DRAFT_437754 [Podila humilis]|nr:MAG: hypothetical protein BYD32DRAFT_437754 [Podila humilis]